MSMYDEMLEMILLALVIIDAKDAKLERIANLMLLGLILWCGLCILEVLNNSCGLGINVGAWFMGTRLLAFQMLYIFLVFSFYITTPTRLVHYLYLWGALALFASFWIWSIDREACVLIYLICVAATLSSVRVIKRIDLCSKINRIFIRR